MKTSINEFDLKMNHEREYILNQINKRIYELKKNHE